MKISLCCSGHFAHHAAVIGSLDLENKEVIQDHDLYLYLLYVCEVDLN